MTQKSKEPSTTARLRHGPRSGVPEATPASADRALLAALLHAVHLQGEHRVSTRGEIGRGGMASVTEEFDQVLQRTVARKTLLDHVRGQPLMVRAFIREAQITSQLDHPNIVPVHDLVLDAQGRLSFTMKRVVGRSLLEVLEEDADGLFIDHAIERLCQRVEILVKVCDALAFAHSRGVLHCDIKAQNIMVGDFGQVYLMDWGFARLLPPRASGGAPVRLSPSAPGLTQIEDPLPGPPAGQPAAISGTPSTMSPEQARGEPLDERSDVFSVGVVLYQALTGQSPYRHKRPIDTLRAAQRGEFPRLSASAALGVIPAELARIVDRATERRPADRYPSVAVLQAELQSFLRGGQSFPTRRAAPGEVIVREGEAGGAAYIIVSGRCEVYRGGGEERMALGTLGPGEVFGELALLLDAPRQATVVALSDVALVVLDRAVIDQELRSMKPWMGALLRGFADRFRSVQRAAAEEVARSRSSPLHRIPEDPGGPWRRFKLW